MKLLKNIIEKEMIENFEYDSSKILNKLVKNSRNVKGINEIITWSDIEDIEIEEPINNFDDKIIVFQNKYEITVKNNYDGDVLQQVDKIIRSAIFPIKVRKDMTNFENLCSALNELLPIELETKEYDIEKISYEILNKINLMTLPNQKYNYAGYLNATPYDQMNIIWANNEKSLAIKKNIDDKNVLPKAITQEISEKQFNDENVICALFSDSGILARDKENNIFDYEFLPQENSFNFKWEEKFEIAIVPFSNGILIKTK